MIASLIFVVIFLTAITVHEFAHAAVADMLGDPTPRSAGRLTLNPVPHMDPIGTLIPLFFILTGSPIIFGWAKPVPINPYNFRDPAKGSMVVSFAGPLSNFLLAWFIATGVRFVPASIIMQGSTASIISSCILINLALAVFNLIPVPPLDGYHLVEDFIPYEWRRTLEQYGFFILIFILISPQTSFLLMHIIRFLFNLIT